jgi:hypothetical protein
MSFYSANELEKGIWKTERKVRQNLRWALSRPDEFFSYIILVLQIIMQLGNSSILHRTIMILHVCKYGEKEI